MPFCLLVADAARARLYMVGPADPDRPGNGVSFDERSDFVRPERRHPAADALTDHPGTGRSPTGLGFGLDDHRDARTRQIDRGFAAELARAVAATRAARVVVIASPHMLGELRPALAATLANGVEVDDVALDLTRLSTPELHERLADLGLVRRRKRLARN